MGKFAESTTVSPDASRAEIEKTLRRYGATSFAYGWEETKAAIQFKAHDRFVRFELEMPDPRDRAFTHTAGRGLERSATAAQAEYDKATRQRWRALALVVKAKLEAVDAGISEFEDEFLAHIVAADGRTIGEHVRPTIERMYQSGEMPASLLALPRGT